jgi:hypothetical protein
MSNPMAEIEKTVIDLSEGNPGAITALAATFKTLGEGQFSTLVHHLRQLGFKGSEIYLCWNDYANRDLYKFFEGVRTKDPEMVGIVNREMGR